MENEETSYILDFETAARAGNGAGEVDVLRRAVAEQGYQSAEVSALALSICSLNRPYMAFLEEFLRQNPESIHPAQLHLAYHYAGMAQFDQATREARHLLNKLRRPTLSQEMINNVMLGALVGQAYWLLTAAYTEVGARSYSKRVLLTALRLPIPIAFTKTVKNELANLDGELARTDLAALDAQWEKFFATGFGFPELHALCVSRGFATMASRLELLETQFRFARGYTVDESEMLMDIFTLTGAGREPVHMLK